MTRIAIVRREKCNPNKCQKECERFCPINRTGQDCITFSNEDGKALIDEALCNGCGICVKRCPFDVISIINLPEEMSKDPIHQYGENGFRLYKLPIPIFSKVVGILGMNGIGKSTAMKILAGLLKPNLGNLEKKEARYSEIIEYFKGTEAQGFFEKVRDNKITLSFKPQNVDMIPKKIRGNVGKMLKNVDEKGIFDQIIKRLELEKILDNDITEISGGELQRVAIAATVLKKANLYIFDEPTSYLDVKQRIKISDFIRELADENTAVMVVEHDLIILDHMTDLLHLMYGKESCFGVVSQPKTTRAGINVYLSGYLKEENIRFRDHEIKFLSKPPGTKESHLEMIEWGAITKKLGKFQLEAEKGSIHQDQVIGILGENGIGKTSFVKILAGVINPDEGKLKESVKVSYKPQYLEPSDEIVSVALKEAVSKFETQLIRPLQIKPLLLKKLNELSGGELQRVAIANCLSKDADMYLLDEPSAYLDVEQRLNVSKVIKDIAETKGKSVLVVDHDVLFIDYLSKNLIVFEGVPAESGTAKGPFTMEEGMNIFLENLGITFRRDDGNNRPRANKLGSQMDRKQKEENKLYYL